MSKHRGSLWVAGVATGGHPLSITQHDLSAPQQEPSSGRSCSLDLAEVGIQLRKAAIPPRGFVPCVIKLTHPGVPAQRVLL